MCPPKTLKKKKKKKIISHPHCSHSWYLIFKALIFHTLPHVLRFTFHIRGFTLQCFKFTASRYIFFTLLLHVTGPFEDDAGDVARVCGDHWYIPHSCLHITLLHVTGALEDDAGDACPCVWGLLIYSWRSGRFRLSQLQLLGVSALLIAAKFVERFPPEVRTLHNFF